MLRPDDLPSEYISFAAAERDRLELLPADTPEECKRTARLLTGDPTVEPKGEYNYEWYVGGQRSKAAVHAGGYMNQPVMIRWQIDSLWGEAGVLQHPEGKYVDRDDSAITFGQGYRDPRYRREIELSDDLAAQLQADTDQLRQIGTDPAVVETDPDVSPARIPQVCYLDSDEVRFYNRLAWAPERRAMFYEAGGGPDFIFPIQKLEDHGLVCRTDPIMRDLEQDRDLSPEDYGLEPMPA
jgi:hypothetical protein